MSWTRYLASQKSFVRCHEPNMYLMMCYKWNNLHFFLKELDTYIYIYIFQLMIRIEVETSYSKFFEMLKKALVFRQFGIFYFFFFFYVWLNFEYKINEERFGLLSLFFQVSVYCRVNLLGYQQLDVINLSRRNHCHSRWQINRNLAKFSDQSSQFRARPSDMKKVSSRGTRRLL